MIPIRDWGEAVRTSVATALSVFLGAIPKIIGFLAILIIGWIIAGILAKAVAAVLRAIRFNDLANRSGFTQFVQQMGVKRDPAGVIADLVRWFVRLIVLVVAFDALGLPAVSQVLQGLLLWLPNLVVALVILVLAGLAANALADLMRGAMTRTGFSNPDLLANVARIAVWGFAIVAAVNQIGIAETLVNTLFIGLVAALALAFGLSFGLGARETMAEIVQSWYRQSQQVAPKLERAVAAAGEQVESNDRARTYGTQTLPSQQRPS